MWRVAAARENFRAVGEWLKVHGEAVYDSERCELSGGMIGTWSRRGTTGYLNIFRWPGEEAQVPLVKTRARSATLLATGERVKIEHASNGRLIFKGLPKNPPHPFINVIKVKFDGIPKAKKETRRGAWLFGDA